MADQVKLPLVGETNKKTLLIGGGAAVVLMGVLWYRKKKTPVTPASPADTTGATTDTSGYLDTSGYIGGGGGTTAGGFPIVPPAVFTDNSQWYADATQKLAGTVDPGALSSALGKYLTGHAVTGDEETIIDEAIAASGYPPVHGPNDYPPGIRTQAGGGQTNPPPPPPSGGGSGGGSNDWTTHTTVHEGERLSQVLAYGGGMSQADFEAHNPGITGYYRWYKAGKGYQSGPGNGAVIALNTNGDIAVLVKSGGW